MKELIDKELKDSRITVLPLHSDIVIDQQRLAFDRPRPSYRKVILATSIAESSITVPGEKLKHFFTADFLSIKNFFKYNFI